MKGKLKLLSATIIVFVLLLNIIMPSAKVFADTTNGILEVALTDQDSFSGNTITYSNGYTLEISSDATLNFQTNNNNNCETAITQGTDVTFTLTLPESSSVVPDLLIGGNREHFAATANNKVYSYDYTVQFNNNGTWLMIELEYPNNPGGTQEQEDNFRVILDGTVSGQNVSYNVDGTTVNITVDSKYSIASNKEVQVPIDETGAISGLTVGSNFNNETMQVKINGADNFNAVLSVNNGKIFIPGSVHIPANAVTNLVIASNEGDDDEQYGDDDVMWDQTAYIVWATDDESGSQTGKFYYSKLTNLAGNISYIDETGGFQSYAVDQNGNRTDEIIINYVKASDITAINDSSVKFTVKQKRVAYHTDTKQTTTDTQAYEFIKTDVFEKMLADENFMAMSATDKMDLILSERIGLDPTNAISGENSISTNGDRIFRLTIYDDSYEGLTIGVPSNYKYYPSFWDPTFHSDTVDITGTTEANPLVFEAFLLEPTLTINTDAYSKNIVSVEAINVPSKAVTVSKVSNGKFNITYSSNYYDNVEFKLTDSNGKAYYVQISRVNLRAKTLYGLEGWYAQLYYPSTESYKDYSIVVSINYKNGTQETKIVETPSDKNVSEGGDLINASEISGGYSLKQACYKLPVDESTVKDFSIIAIKKGALEGNSYGGTFAGSKTGIEYKNDGKRFMAVNKAVNAN